MEMEVIYSKLITKDKTTKEGNYEEILFRYFKCNHGFSLNNWKQYGIKCSDKSII